MLLRSYQNKVDEKALARSLLLKLETSMKKKFLKALVAFCVVASFSIFALLDLESHLTFQSLKDKHALLLHFYSQNRIETIAIFMFFYIAVTALSLPGAAVMSLAGGAVLGFWPGLIAVSFASSIGATLAFLTSRFVLRDWVQDKFKEKLKYVNNGMEKDGGFYLFSLRLVPAFPFFMVNLLMGLTPIKASTYYIISQLGMLPATVVFINAGTRLGEIKSVSDILSPSLALSFAVLGFFPLAARVSIQLINKRRFLSKFKKPEKFDYNLVVIGGGAAGLVSAYVAATVKAKVALIEKDKMGGDCLNTGCVPSKALIKTARVLSYSARAENFGLKALTPYYDFKDIMKRVKDIINRIEPHDSSERYTGLGVECIKGMARITSPYTVNVGNRVLTTRNVIIATGASPFVPRLPGLEDVDCLTSDNVWELENLPGRLVVLGGGPIGCELAQCFARIGSKVTIIELAQTILNKEDLDVSNLIEKRLEAEGIKILLSHKALRVEKNSTGNMLVCEFPGNEVRVDFDKILIALGRKANVHGLGLEELGIELTPSGSVNVDEFMATSCPNIFCAGDVTGLYQFTHAASLQAWHASVNSLFGWIKKFKIDYNAMPWATFTDPEVARVGLNEKDALITGMPYEITKYALDDLDRAIADSEDHGFVKVLTKPGTDKIIGACIVGNHAADVIHEFVLAMKHGIGLNKILAMTHIYPTMSEACKFTAGQWKKERTSERVFDLLKKINHWRLG